MKIVTVLTVFTMILSACGLEATARSTVVPPASEAMPASEASEESPTSVPKPKVGLTTPLLLILSSTAAVACVYVLSKYCARKLYHYLARPNYSQADWHKYDDFMRTEILNAFTKHSGEGSDFGKAGKQSSSARMNWEERFRKDYEDLFGDGSWERHSSHHHRQQHRAGQQGGGYYNRAQPPPPHSDFQGDAYALLEIGKDAAPEEIKTAFYTLAKKHHPDKNPGDPEAEAKFKQINAAYQWLKEKGKV